MVEKFFDRGKRILSSPQNSVLSAASVIALMSVASRVLGLVRQSVLSHFFSPEDLSLFFAAFRLPDLIFEVLVYGTFSSAFIPVFAKATEKGNGHAWKIASTVVNLGLLIFGVVAILFSLFAGKIYGVIAPGFDFAQTQKIASMARILFAAQGFFLVSYVMTGVLESLRRFLVPALAPVFYNIGIIAATAIFSPELHLMAPVVGVVAGAILHFSIQLPLAWKLGFRFSWKIEIDDEVKKIGRLAGPRVIDLSFQQIGKIVELMMASLISVASYTYLTFANTLQLVPVSLFGTSVAKATLPTLAKKESKKEFADVLYSSLYQVIFFVLPLAAAFIVLRIPLTRLVYGRRGFGWEATLETGYVLTAFALSTPFQAMVALLSRGFYALHDTKTPVIISIVTMVLMIVFDLVLILGFHLPTWALAASFSLANFIQATVLYFILMKRLEVDRLILSLRPVGKSLLASIVAGSTMLFLLKIFDKSVWIKRLSFVGKLNVPLDLSFQSFVLDTRYALNLLILTAFVGLVGALVYLFFSWLIKSEQLVLFMGMIKRRKMSISRKEEEVLSPPASQEHVE